MLTFTEKAREMARFYLESKDASWGIRIRMADQGFALSLTQYNPDSMMDKISEVDGLKVICDPFTARSLVGAKVDFIENEQGKGFKIEVDESKPLGKTPPSEADLSKPVVKRVHDLLQSEINPGLAAHGGFAKVVDVDEEGTAFLKFGGGCQGCSQIDATVKHGVEVRLRQVIPEIKKVIDTTDHAKGNNPYL